MLRQYIVYGSFGAVCIEDDSLDGVAEQIFNMFDQEFERITKIVEVNVCNYPY